MEVHVYLIVICRPHSPIQESLRLFVLCNDETRFNSKSFSYRHFVNCPSGQTLNVRRTCIQIPSLQESSFNYSNHNTYNKSAILLLQNIIWVFMNLIERYIYDFFFIKQNKIGIK